MHSDEFDPPKGSPQQIDQGIRRIVAPNPGPMTYRGTNTYLVGTRRIAVIDPGPDNAAHLAAILAALRPGQAITHIFVTHAHKDHSGLARALSDATDAPVLAFGDALAGRSAVMQALVEGGLRGGGEGVDAGFTPDISLRDARPVAGDGWILTPFWTPGHMGNHMCFGLGDAIFTGDLVMGWSSSLVSPPDGDMAAYRRSCLRLTELAPRRLHPGHGAPITAPDTRISALLAHRASRERQIIAALKTASQDLPTLTRTVYGDLEVAVLIAASRNTLAHLIDLHARSQIRATPEIAQSATFHANR